MDDITNLIPAEWQATVLLVLTVASLAMPLLEWIANRTATDLDNRAVALLARVLSFVPRVRLGNTRLSAATVARTSKMPPPIPPTVAMLLSVAVYGATMSAIVLGGLACAGTPTTREVLEGARRAEESMERMCEELARTKPLREEVTDVVESSLPMDRGDGAGPLPGQPAANEAAPAVAPGADPAGARP